MTLTDLKVIFAWGSAPPEAESSVAFEAPAKEPNLTLVTDSFLLSGWCLGGSKFVTLGA